MELRTTFNTISKQYDISRPKYPTNIFNDITSIMHIDYSSEILEIGCGTGQATELFINSNANITCLDIGNNQIEFAKNKFKYKNNISFILSSLEDFSSTHKYNLILSATAYHWIKQPEGNIKVKSLLNDNGYFAILHHHHVNMDKGFFYDSQSIYKNYMVTSSIDKSIIEMDPTVFTIALNKEYFWQVEYSADQYINLISTYSDHIILPVNKKILLFKELRELINDKYNGKILKEYNTTLQLGA
jgi:SAM-dependent methyltransferase